MSRRLALIRHGSTGHDGRLMGKTDAALNAEGRASAARLCGLLRDLLPARCVCSPMRRARETAELALRAHAGTLVVEPDLREVDFGCWEGMSFDEVREASPERVNAWVADGTGFRFPGGESIGDFVERVRGVGRRLVTDSAESVIVVAHGGVIRQLICHCLGLPWSAHLAFQIRHAALSVIEIYEGKGVLAGLNLLPSPATGGA